MDEVIRGIGWGGRKLVSRRDEDSVGIPADPATSLAVGARVLVLEELQAMASSANTKMITEIRKVFILKP